MTNIGLLFILALISLSACSTPQNRSPQSVVRREFQRFQLLRPVAIQNTAAYTVEKVLLATDSCKISVTLPPGEEFALKAKDSLQVSNYTVSRDEKQLVKVDFLPVKTRPLKMDCHLDPEQPGHAEQKVAQEFVKTFMTHYRDEREKLEK
jgi:hypothetical protein